MGLKQKIKNAILMWQMRRMLKKAMRDLDCDIGMYPEVNDEST